MAKSKSSAICQRAMAFLPKRKETAGMNGDLMKRLREKTGISQEQMAAEVGCATSQISRFETNQRIPRVDELITIARVLKVRPSVFVEPSRRTPPQLESAMEILVRQNPKRADELYAQILALIQLDEQQGQ